jgi:hypothetical protein
VGSADPPTFEASLSVPAELTLGATFSATVTVTNTGGSRGSYRGRIRAFAGMIYETDRAVEVGPIEPGETRETAVGPVVAPYAGGWTVELVDEASAAVDVFPVTVDVGDAVEVAGGLRLTVESVAIRDGYDYLTSTGDSGRRTPPAGRRLLFATLDVENVGDDPRATPSRSEFSAASADGRAPVYHSPESWDEYRWPGTPYPGKRRIDPGTSLSGWVALLVPVPADGVVAVVWNRDLPASPPEALWRSRPDSRRENRESPPSTVRVGDA